MGAQNQDQAELPIICRVESNRSRLVNAAIDLANADAEDDAAYELLEDRLRKLGIETGELALRRAAADPSRPPGERRLCARAAEVLRCIRRGSAT